MHTDDPAAIYRDIRTNITALVAGLAPEQLDAVAPATPEWRVRDVVAHLAGGTADIVAGNLEDVASDAWTAAQVATRRDTPIAEVLDEWERCSALVEPTIAAFPGIMRAMLLTDAVTHEHDIRGAIGRPGRRDSDAIGFSFSRLIGAISAQRAERGALRIVHDAGEEIAGTEPVTATVRVSRFEIVRAAVGRRSEAQILTWSWDGEADPKAIVLGRFAPPRATDLVE
jgi:uncharacterized protein (TIGR03083 family)